MATPKLLGELPPAAMPKPSLPDEPSAISPFLFVSRLRAGFRSYSYSKLRKMVVLFVNTRNCEIARTPSAVDFLQVAHALPVLGQAPRQVTPPLG